MRKEDKSNIIVQLGDTLKEYAHFYLVDVTGLNAATTSAMRRKCFQSEVKMVVVKNTLLHKAFEAAEVQCYRDARTASVNSRVYNLVNYLSKARPELTSGQIAELIGFPEEAVDEEYEMMTAEICAEVNAAVKKLPPQTKLVIELSMQDMTVEEIASALHVSSNTIKSLKKRVYCRKLSLLN